MNRTELIAELQARQPELSKRLAGDVVASLFDGEAGIIAKALKKGEAVTLTGFGNFEQRQRKARTFRNPRTGDPVKAKAMKVPAFRAGLTLRATVKGVRKVATK